MKEEKKKPSGQHKEETAAQRLRRILASSQGKAQDVEDFGTARKKARNKELEALRKTVTRKAEKTKVQKSNALEEPVAKKEDTSQVNITENIETLELSDLIQNIKDSASASFEKIKARLSSASGGGKPPRRGNEKPFYQRFGKDPFGCLLSGFLGFTFTIIVIGILGLSFVIFQYFTIAAGLPSVDDLAQYASQFETTRIYDRDGNLIYEILDPNAGRRSYTELDDISPFLIAATIATEDKDFYSNPGFDPWGILRAFWQNYTSGEVVSGASTITQQLARTLLLSPEERSQITTQRKAREIVLAAEITRQYSKDEILELYLNEIYYGNLAYGIEAAAETYFNITADQLNMAQASFLAGLPQSPAIYDVHTNRESALLRHVDVLNLMFQLSSERNCIPVNQSNVPICITLDEAVAAAQEIELYEFVQRPVTMPYPHWVNYIRAQLEAQFDPQTIYRSGFKVFTTLDPDFQAYAQQSVKEQVDALVENEATNGALVAIKPHTGEVLALVGSADFFKEEISGQVNMAVAPRQPGSSIKPLTYTAAFEKGWTPSTLIWDVKSEFPPSGNPDDTRDPYIPVNYDSKYHGPVLVRTALGSSYNVPAVKTLHFVGIYDDPDTPERDGLVAFAERMGITTLTRDDYGLSLTLGGGDVSLLELTGAYAIFANGGSRTIPYSIERIEDHFGNVVYQHESIQSAQVIKADHAYLISDILSDNSARTPAFGSSSILNLPFPAAVKTGTTNDFRDNWTLGYTPDIAIGVWIGNADYSPMKNISGVTGAAPLWSDVMQWAIDHYHDGSPSRFERPDTIEDHVVCVISGTEPSDGCPRSKSEMFAAGQPPLDEDEDIWQDIEIDTWTNYKAGPACSEFTEEKLTLNVSDEWALKWIKEKDAGKAWAKDMGFPDPIIFTPERECTGDDPRPTIVFVGLSEEQDVTTPVLDIYAVAKASKYFEKFKLQYGVGSNPSKWQTLRTIKEEVSQPEKLISWDVYEADAARITLRIYMTSSKDTFAEKRIRLDLKVPALTPTLTLTPSDTPEPTLTLAPTETATPEVSSTETEDTPTPEEEETATPEEPPTE